MSILKTILLMQLACSMGASHTGQSYTINGILHEAGEQTWAYLSYQSNGIIHHDSTRIRYGRFTFTGNIAEPVLSTISISTNACQPPHATTSFYLEPGPILLEIGADKKVTVKGPKANEDYSRLQQLRIELIIREKPGDFEEFLRQEQNICLKFIAQHQDSWVSLRLVTTHLSHSFTTEEIEKIFNSLSVVLKNSATGIAFQRKLKQLRRLADSIPGLTQRPLKRLSFPKIKYSSMKTHLAMV